MNSASDKSLNPEDAGVAQKKPTAPETLLGEEPGIKGLDELIGKIEPLLASGRLNRVVDAMSLLADLVDMTDDYMLEKLMKGFEEGLGAAWTVGNAARMASDQVRTTQATPTVMGLIRLAKEPEVRRGLTFFLMMAGVMGRQMQYQNLDHTED